MVVTECLNASNLCIKTLEDREDGGINQFQSCECDRAMTGHQDVRPRGTECDRCRGSSAATETRICVIASTLRAA